MPLTKGKRISHYEILDAIGAGAMGEVWRAREARLGREVAIKVLPEHFASDRERLKRFEREAQMLASLNHPNIAQIFGVDQVDDTYFLVLELVPGESLEERLKRGPLSLDEAFDVCAQIAEGLEAAHETGVIHRDLKPANVRITPEGKVKVLDFGLAKSLRPKDEASAESESGVVTQDGVILGTPRYMSPEQVRGRQVDRRADIWAFGCLLFECLTGRRVFGGYAVADIFAGIVGRQPDWSPLPASTPQRVRKMLARCLDKDPRQRLRDIGEARIVLAAHGGAAESAWPKRWSALLAAALAALIVGAALGAWLSRARESSTAPGSFRRLNFGSEAVFHAAFAPDGKTVVYSAARNGNTPEIFVARPENPEPQPLGLHGVHLLAVSSKGELAVLTGAKFVAQRLFVGTLAHVPLGGIAPREMIENVRQADWTPDGTGIAIIRMVGGKDRLEYPVGKVLRETSGYLSDLRFSPDGGRIAYFEHPARWDNRGSLNVVDLEGHVTLLADGHSGEETLAWTPDGAEILYSANLGELGLARSVYSVSASRPRHVAFEAPDGLTLHDVSRDGRWLVTQDRKAYGIRVHRTGVDSDVDLTWPGGSIGGVLSRDAKTLVFCEQAGTAANYEVCLRSTDGSPVVRLGEGVPRDLSRDGRWVIAGVPTSPMKLVVYPTGAGEARQIDCGPLISFSTACWLADESKILIHAAERSAGVRYYIMDVRGGVPRPVTPEWTSAGLLSPDEQRVLVEGPDRVFRTYALDGGESRAVEGLTHEDTLFHWGADGQSVLVTRGATVPCRVERVNLATGARDPFLEIAPADSVGLLSVAPRSITADERTYTYEYIRMTSGMFVSGGSR